MDNNDRLDKLEGKIDHISETLVKQELNLGRMVVIVDEHQRRSTAQEENVALLRKELKPVFSHISVMNFLGKIAIAIISSGMIWQIISHFIH